MSISIAEFSDLHLTHSQYPYDLPRANVCVLPGDLVDMRMIDDPRFHSFLKYVSDTYAIVFYVPGNHEYYFGQLSDVEKRLNKLFDEKFYNIFLLQKKVIDYKGIIFLGATLWTNFNNNSEKVKLAARLWMNDYRSIDSDRPNPRFKEQFLPLDPNDTLRIHEDHKFFFEEMIEKHSDKPIVCISHHQPSMKSIHPKYKGNELNGAFCSDCESLMKPNVKYWFAGHVHNSFDYKVGETRVICNPKGYHNENPNFNPNLVVEL